MPEEQVKKEREESQMLVKLGERLGSVLEQVGEKLTLLSNKKRFLQETRAGREAKFLALQLKHSKRGHGVLMGHKKDIIVELEKTYEDTDTAKKINKISIVEDVEGKQIKEKDEITYLKDELDKMEHLPKNVAVYIDHLEKIEAAFKNKKLLKKLKTLEVPLKGEEIEYLEEYFNYLRKPDVHKENIQYFLERLKKLFMEVDGKFEDKELLKELKKSTAVRRIRWFWQLIRYLLRIYIKISEEKEDWKYFLYFKKKKNFKKITNTIERGLGEKQVAELMRKYFEAKENGGLPQDWLPFLFRGYKQAAYELEKAVDSLIKNEIASEKVLEIVEEIRKITPATGLVNRLLNEHNMSDIIEVASKSMAEIIKKRITELDQEKAKAKDELQHLVNERIEQLEKKHEKGIVEIKDVMKDKIREIMKERKKSLEELNLEYEKVSARIAELITDAKNVDKAEDRMGNKVRELLPSQGEMEGFAWMKKMLKIITHQVKHGESLKPIEGYLDKFSQISKELLSARIRDSKKAVKMIVPVRKFSQEVEERIVKRSEKVLRELLGKFSKVLDKAAEKLGINPALVAIR